MSNEEEAKALVVRALIFIKLRHPERYQQSLDAIKGFIQSEHLRNAQLSSATGAMDLFLTFDAGNVEEVQNKMNKLRQQLKDLIGDTQTYVGSILI